MIDDTWQRRTNATSPDGVGAPSLVDRHAWLRQRWTTLIVGFGVAFAVGLLFARVVQTSASWNQGLAWERSLLMSIPRPLPAPLDAVMLVVPWFGTNLSLIPVVVVVAVWLWRSRRRADLAVRLALVQLGSYLLNPALKFAVERARPTLVERRGWYGWSAYPSGHAIAGVAVLMTFALLLHRERGWRWPLAVAATLTTLNMYSRMYLGVHWPTDVLGGAIVGVVWLAATMIAFRDSGNAGR